ncbi:MAG: hypothetical protein ABWY93_32510 [Mycobacterium sp.]
MAVREWGVEQMVASFPVDSTVYHFHGTVHGHDGFRHLFATPSPFRCPPARDALNEATAVD